ncbi:type V toxin-antitoxin system endoribonuclease antitoxin GhoS [Siccibacter turicensis]
MSNDDIKRFIVTVTGADRSLTDVNELTNAMTGSGFALTITDEDGKVRELGPMTFSLLGPQGADEVKAMAEGLAESAIGRKPEVTVVPLHDWLAENESR